MTAATLRRALALALLLPLGGCAVVAVTGAVVGAGVSVVSTAADVAVATGKGVVHVGSAVLGSDDK